MKISKKHEAIDKYARSRSDVYAWAPTFDQNYVILLISEEADVSSFPKGINGVRFMLKQVPPPKPQ